MTKPPMTWPDRDGPDNPSILPPLGRRGLLASAAILPAAAPGRANASQPPPAWELRFALSTDGTTLVVTETEPAQAGDRTKRTSLIQSISSSVFGPRAWFDMAQPASDRAPRRLDIRNVTYGEASGYVVSLLFTLSETRWHVKVGSTLWGNADAFGPSTGFAAFCGGTACTQPNLRGDRVGAAIEAIFGHRLRLVPAKPRLTMSLDRNLVWTLRADGPALSCFDGQVTTRSLRFAWSRERLANGQPGKTVFFGHAAAAEPAAGGPLKDGPAGETVAAPGGLRLGPRDGHHAALTIPPGKPLVLDLRVAASPLVPNLNQTVLGLHVHSGAVAVAVRDTVVAGPIEASGLVVTETFIPDPQLRDPVRTVLWGNVADASPQQIRSPVGPLLVGPPAVEPRPDAGATAAQSRKQPTPLDEPAAAPEMDAAASTRFMQAACGDRQGVGDAAIFVVSDAQLPATATSGLRRIAIGLTVLQSSVSPPDLSFSRLTFDRADLQLIYEDGHALFRPSRTEFPRRHASSWVWAGQGVHASIDLSRATLTCARDYDLAKVRLKFQDLCLVFEPPRPAAPFPGPVVRPAHESCRVLQRPDGTVIDGRPTLVAEFDPQHVMEEALFRPEPPTLPDVDLKASPYTKAEILLHLAQPATPQESADYRKGVQDEKIKATGVPTAAFKQLAEAYKDAAAAARLPVDQAVYIGPFALAPDAMALARKVQRSKGSADVQAEIAAMLVRVEQTVKDLRARNLLLPVTPPLTLPDARRNETLLEQAEPLYAAFREFWRDRVTQALADASAVPPRPNNDGLPSAAGLDGALLADFLATGNRPEAFATLAMTDWIDKARAALVQRFVDVAMGLQPVPDLVGARLSGCTRLAFRINCEPLAGLDGDAAGTAGSTGPGPGLPGQGGAAFAPIPFTFEHLTDWSRHEPAVTRRAQKLYQPLPSGLLPPLGNRAADATDEKILVHQGIGKGIVTAAQRLGEIRAALATLPTELETAIEIPARLVLSTAQDAVWMTNRRLSLRTRPGLEQASRAEPPGHAATISAPHRLWSVRLAIQDVSPGLRAIASPDLRPMALGRGLQPEPLPGHGAPPRGPWAPWFIGPEQMDGLTLGVDPASCPPPAPDTKPSPFRLVRYLCERLGRRGDVLRANYSLFRTSIDANDRHQLVLQTSAYGLPVIGRREDLSGGTGSADNSGRLVEGSGQIEPGEAFSLLDAKDGQAIYRPVPLDVQELTLTALGGSFLHDTRFIPAAGAVDLRGRKIFDGFSIERWQHEVVLGRDIRAQVVYKGYLMPFGHRASLVKLTERIFLITPKQGIKAILRQRMFLRIGNPLMRYPAIGQPHGGRLWCGAAVEITTKHSPDLLDPTTPDPTPHETLNGRVDLGGNPGLAFWPRTDITPAGLVRFDVLFDGAFVRLPLLFLDNVAATTTESLRAAVGHYNGTAPGLPSALVTDLQGRRTAKLGGQAVRYAVEDRPGDTSFPTETIDIKVGGRLQAGELSWTGPLGEFETTPVLEGADQPPFYPEMDGAAIRLTQLERLSGAPAPADVQFDGHYVRYGFPGTSLPPGETQPAGPGSNPLCVFLDLRDLVPFKMGSNGDRAGGIGRPDSDVVAISRVKGPLGASNTITYRKKDSSTDKDVVIDPKTTTTLITGLGLDQGLTSLVKQFYAAPVSTAMADPDAAELVPVADGAAPVSEQIKQLQSYFNGDAKLLGVITLQNLMEVMGIDTELPALKEVVQYGSGALDKLNGLAADVRVRVLLPLQAAMLRLQREWQALDGKLADSQRELGAERLTLKTLFPEVQDGINEVTAALEAALATEDAVALQGSLGAVFSAGRRLVRNLAILAAHPVEHLEEAAGTRVRILLNRLTGLLPGWATKAVALAQDVMPLLKLDPGRLADAVADWVFPPDAGNGGAMEEELSAALPVPVPLPDLKSIASRMLEDVPADAAAFVAAAAKVGEELQKAGKGSAKALLRSVLKQLFAAGNVDLPSIVKPVARAYLDDLKAAVDNGKPPLLRAIRRIPDHGKAELVAAKAALAAAVEAYAARLAAGAAGSADTLELAAIEAAALRIARLVQAARDLAFAASATPVRIEAVLGAAGALAHEMFGFDDARLQTGATALATAFKTGLADALARSPIPLRPASGKLGRFRRETQACLDHHSPPPITPADPASTPLLQTIGEATAALVDTGAHAAALRNAIDQHGTQLHAAGMPDNTVAALAALASDLQTLQTELGSQLDGLACDIVASMLAVTGLADPGIPPTDTEGLARHAALLAQLSASGASLAARLAKIVRLVAQFASGHTVADLRNGLIGGAFAVTDGFKASALIDVSNLRADSARAEEKLTAALTVVVDTAVSNLAYTALPRTQLKTLGQSVADLGARAEKLGFSLKPEVDDLAASLAGLDGELAGWEPPGKVTDVRTVKALLDTELKPGITVRALFEDTRFKSALDKIRGLEVEVLALQHAVGRAVAGLPEGLRTRIEQRVLTSRAIAGLADASQAFTAARDDALATAAAIPLIRESARKALLVGSCVPAATPPAPCLDDLARESDFLQTLAAKVPPLDPGVRGQLQTYLRSWTSGTAAPQLVLRQFANVIADLARGDVLSVLDLSAYRDLIEDAIANLVPARIDMSYDFSSTVLKEPKKDNIFQPAKGARFGMEVRASVDLLKGQSSFAAKAHLGPFDVKLIGGLVDALTLSFGGASFETGSGTQARFDVQYETFTIGKDLEFAQKLQSYLTPKEGSGIFIQPLSQGIGLEAGYGIDLGIISIGASSFFNVTLNVSAELPFDQHDALFKVALGRRLAPFSISFLPFVGSGYFAIIANARGPIGFEASFEFGAGGSIGFGPLTAQVRIQVGVYVRLMKVKDGLSTTISGTFFAGGAASIWIFSFATSLYVRLGSAEGGAMYGEAVFTFSFSLGIVDYDFSVTAFRRERAIGGQDSGANGSAALAPPGDPAATMFAGLDELVIPAAGEAAKQDVKSPERKTRPSATPKPRPVLNEVQGQGERWDVYAGYFDAKLLDKAALQWPK